MNLIKKNAILFPYHFIVRNFNKRGIFLFLLLSTLIVTMQAQQMITGVVRDSVSREVLPYVSVYYKGTTTGAMTDDKGAFEIEKISGGNLTVSCIGYKEFSSLISKQRVKPMEILLIPSQYQLNEIVVKPGKEKYTRKGNPAVEFIQQVIDRKQMNDPYSKEYFSFRRYEKLTYALNNFDSIEQNKLVYRHLKFLKNYVDTSMISKKPILPVSVKEMVELNYLKNKSGTKRKIVEGYKKSGIDQVLSGDGMDKFSAETFKEIDIYQNDISLFLIRFVSPLSDIGTRFYKYYLNDTVFVNGVQCRDVSFVPVQSESLGFTGHLYVALDSSYFVKKAILNVPRHINLNFVDNMVIEQEYDRTSDHIRMLKKDDVAVEFKLIGKSGGFYARRINMYSGESFEAPADSIFEKSNPVVELKGAKGRDSVYWQQNRGMATAGNDENVKGMLNEMRRVPVYYYSEKLLAMLIDGYIPTAKENSKFDIGPVSTLISGNSFEGARFRFGGMTTPALNKNWFAEGYLAYGTRDKKLKYRGQLEYSFIDKETHQREFPVHSVKLSYMYDINKLGQQYGTGNKDNIFTSVSRKNDDRVLYLRKAELGYQREFYSGFSYEIELRNMIQYATSSLHFDQLLPDSTLNPLRSFGMTEAELKLRYSPGEKFYQMKDKRIRITRDAPEFYLSHIIAVKGFMGSDYSLNRTEVGFNKYFWLSAFGSLSVKLNAGKIWNKVPFPLLIIPKTNMSYTIQPNSFSLMNPLEFINDQYALWDVTYHMSGWLLNYVPLVKKLKLREIVSFRGMFGSLSKKNLPENNSDLFVFPTASYRMGSTPYMEVSAGLTNILKLFRIEYVWRLTYRDHPDINKSGIRVGLHVSF